METKWTQAARRHRVGKASARFVMASSDPIVDVNDRGEEVRTWVGPDARGRELEVVAVVATDNRTGEVVLLVLHVFPTALRGPK